MLAALVAGHTAPHLLADWAEGRRCDTRAPLGKALAGRVKPPQRVVWTALLGQSDRRDDTSARVEAQSQQRRGPCDETVGLLDPLPGVAHRTAETLVAEVGTARGRLLPASPLAAWAGGAPGRHERAGTQRSGPRRNGHKPLGEP